MPKDNTEAQPQWLQYCRPELRVLASALAIYGAATATHGSGFLAVFIAGIIIGDERAPDKREIARFHSALASLAEIVAFTMLGLTIQLHNLAHRWAWLTGLVLVIRPLLVGVLLWPVRLRRRERLCVLWTGLKGAVPILLGAFIVQAGVTGAHRLSATASSWTRWPRPVPHLGRELHRRLQRQAPPLGRGSAAGRRVRGRRRRRRPCGGDRHRAHLGPRSPLLRPRPPTEGPQAGPGASPGAPASTVHGQQAPGQGAEGLSVDLRRCSSDGCVGF